jgi:L-Ala-D/L-Glu epimerase
MSRVSLRVEREIWPYAAPLRITGYTKTAVEVVVVSLSRDGNVGRGEAAGVRYRNETAASMVEQIEAIRPLLEAGLDRTSLQGVLPPGGARSAVDCALWDLEARLSGRAVWELAGLEPPRPVMTVFTVGAGSPEEVARAARGFTAARGIKLKLNGEPIDLERVRAAREARPDVWLSIDANQGFTFEALARLMPALIEARVALIEQPFPVGQEALLDGLDSSIPIAADESVQSLRDIHALAGRVQMINIKLSKCGGLTEGLAMARMARALDLRVMVGHFGGTSLAMAPAFLLGQLCDLVDLDGPALLAADRTPSIEYVDGLIHCPKTVWGYPTAK